MIDDKAIQNYISKGNVDDVLQHFTIDFFKKHLSKKYELLLVKTISIFTDVYRYNNIKISFNKDEIGEYFYSVGISGYGDVNENIFYEYEYFNEEGLRLIDDKRKEVAMKVIEKLELDRDAKLKEIVKLDNIIIEFEKLL